MPKTWVWFDHIQDDHASQHSEELMAQAADE